MVRKYIRQKISHVLNLIEEDRPYAEWLYGRAVFHSKTYRRLGNFELQLVLTGDFSLAEETQDFVYSIRGIAKANGWDNQIDAEPSFALIYDRKQRLASEIRFS